MESDKCLQTGRKLVIRAIMPTQNEIINTWERLTGKPLSRKDVSTAELEALCQSEVLIRLNGTCINISGL